MYLEAGLINGILIEIVRSGALVLGKIDQTLTFGRSGFIWLVKGLFATSSIFFLVVLINLGKSVTTPAQLYEGFLASIGYSQSGFETLVTQPKDLKPLPILKAQLEPPRVTAKSVLVMDRRYNKRLYGLNEDLKLAPASTTKLLTALVAVDIYDNRKILSSEPACTVVDSTKLGIPSSQKFRAKDLINAMLVSSAGDAACILAEQYKSVDSFVGLMNKKAAELNMTDSHFSNPIGLDDADGMNYSTALDLYKLANAAMNIPSLAEGVKNKQFELKSIDRSYVSTAVSTNRLLWEIEGTTGIKTGTTYGAGEVLIYEYTDSDKDLVIIVMGSYDRFGDTKSLLNWVIDSYDWSRE